MCWRPTDARGLRESYLTYRFEVAGGGRRRINISENFLILAQVLPRWHTEWAQSSAGRLITTRALLRFATARPALSRYLIASDAVIKLADVHLYMFAHTHPTQFESRASGVLSHGRSRPPTAVQSLCIRTCACVFKCTHALCRIAPDLCRSVDDRRTPTKKKTVALTNV